MPDVAGFSIVTNRGLMYSMISKVFLRMLLTLPYHAVALNDI